MLSIVFICIIFFNSFHQTYCAQAMPEEPSCRLFVEDCVVAIEEETPFPTVVSRLVADYRGDFGYRLHQSLPAENVPHVEHALSDELLAQVTYDGDVIIKSLKTDEILKRIELVIDEKEKYCAERPITSFDDYLIIPMDFRLEYMGGGKIVILNTITDEVVSVPDPDPRGGIHKNFIFVPLPENQLFMAYKGSSSADIIDIKTGKSNKKIEADYRGFTDALLLPDGRFVVAGGDAISFTLLSDFLKYGSKARSSQYLFDQGPRIRDLAVLSPDRLAVRGYGCYARKNASVSFLRVFDTKTLSQLSKAQFEDSHFFCPYTINVAALSGGDIAVKKEKLEEVDLFYADGTRETLPFGKRVSTIQGLCGGNLFVKFTDGSKSLCSKKFSQALYEQQKAKMALLKKQQAQQGEECADALADAAGIATWHAYDEQQENVGCPWDFRAFCTIVAQGHNIENHKKGNLIGQDDINLWCSYDELEKDRKYKRLKIRSQDD